MINTTKLILFLTIIFLASCKVDSPVTVNTGSVVNQKNFAYSQKDYKFNVGEAITPVTPSFNDRGNFKFTVTPELPIGLSIDPTTGGFQGTPLVIDTETQYLFKANLNEVGVEYSFVATIQVTLPPPSDLSYANSLVSFFFNQPSTSALPTVSGIVDYFTIDPPLPPNLFLIAGTGQITGIPSISPYEALHFVTAHNQGGMVTTPVSIRIISQLAPTSINYLLPSYNCPSFIGCAIPAPTVTPALLPGLSFTITPNLPNEFTFNGLDGSINVPAGVFLSPAVLGPYIITATTPGGSVTTTTSVSFINVLENIPVLNYPVATNVLKDIAMSAPISPLPFPIPDTDHNYYSLVSVVAPDMTSSIQLPAGLILNSFTGEISGTPSSAVGNYVVTVRFSLPFPSTSFGVETFDINIIEQIITGLAYPTFPGYLIKDEPAPEFLPMYAGSLATNFIFERFDNMAASLGATLPAGLTWNSQRGIFVGSPTELVTNHVIRVWAVNGIGTSLPYDIPFSITEPAPLSVTYPGSPFTVQMCTDLNIVPVITGGEGSFSTTLPAFTLPGEFPATTESSGLTILENGTISGNVSAHHTTPKNYVVTVANFIGSVFTNIVINTTPDAPLFSVENLNARAGEAITHNLDMVSCFKQSTPIMTPELPTEFNLDTNNNIVYSGDLVNGTPPSLVPLKKYNLSLTNSSGSLAQDFELDLAFRLSASRDKAVSTIVDFDNDASQDIILAEADCPLYAAGNCSQGYISVLRQETVGGEYSKLYGSATASIPGLLLDYSNFSYLHSFDMDGDLYSDVLFYDQVAQKIIILKNVNGNSLEYLTEQPILIPIEHIVYQDKAIITVDGSSNITIYNFNGTNFTATTHLINNLAQGVSHFALTKINNSDPYNDIVIVDQDDNTLCIVESTGLLSYESDCLRKLVLLNSGAKEVYAAPFSLGLNHDLAVLYQDTTSSISIITNNGDSFVTAPTTTTPNFSTTMDPSSLTIGDINNDNKLDIIVKKTQGIESEIYFISGSNVAVAPIMQAMPHTTSINSGQLVNGVDGFISCHESAGIGTCRMIYNGFYPFVF